MDPVATYRILKILMQGIHLYLGKYSVGMSGITHLNKISEHRNV